MMMIFCFSDKMVEGEMYKEQKYVEDAAYLLVEIVEDDVGVVWWRWLVCGGLDPKKEGRRIESIWWRRTVYGGYKSTRGEKNLVNGVAGGG